MLTKLQLSTGGGAVSLHEMSDALNIPLAALKNANPSLAHQDPTKQILRPGSSLNIPTHYNSHQSSHSEVDIMKSQLDMMKRISSLQQRNKLKEKIPTTVSSLRKNTSSSSSNYGVQHQQQQQQYGSQSRNNRNTPTPRSAAASTTGAAHRSSPRPSKTPKPKAAAQPFHMSTSINSAPPSARLGGTANRKATGGHQAVKKSSHTPSQQNQNDEQKEGRHSQQQQGSTRASPGELGRSVGILQQFDNATGTAASASASAAANATAAAAEPIDPFYNPNAAVDSTDTATSQTSTLMSLLERGGSSYLTTNNNTKVPALLTGGAPESSTNPNKFFSANIPSEFQFNSGGDAQASHQQQQQEHPDVSPVNNTTTTTTNSDNKKSNNDTAAEWVKVRSAFVGGAVHKTNLELSSAASSGGVLSPNPNSNSLSRSPTCSPKPGTTSTTHHSKSNALVRMTFDLMSRRKRLALQNNEHDDEEQVYNPETGKFEGGGNGNDNKKLSASRSPRLSTGGLGTKKSFIKAAASASPSGDSSSSSPTDGAPTTSQQGTGWKRLQRLVNKGGSTAHGRLLESINSKSQSTDVDDQDGGGGEEEEDSSGDEMSPEEIHRYTTMSGAKKVAPVNSNSVSSQAASPSGSTPTPHSSPTPRKKSTTVASVVQRATSFKTTAVTPRTSPANPPAPADWQRDSFPRGGAERGTMELSAEHVVSARGEFGEKRDAHGDDGLVTFDALSVPGEEEEKKKNASHRSFRLLSHRPPPLAVVNSPDAAKKEDDDAEEEEQEQLSPKFGFRGRRQTVCNARLDTEDIANFAVDEKMFVPKGEEEKAFLLTVLEDHELFCHLELDDLEKLIDTMHVLDQCPKKGDVIIKCEEDIDMTHHSPTIRDTFRTPAPREPFLDRGDYFYVVGSGEVGVIEDADPTVMHHLNPGDTMQDTALLYKTPMHSHVVALTESDADAAAAALSNSLHVDGGCDNVPTVVYALSRPVYRTIIANSQTRKRQLYEGFLNKIEFLKKANLNKQEMLSLADALKTIEFEDGDYLINYGEEAKAFYLILEGNVNVMGRETNPATGQSRPKKVFEFTEPGSHLGELEFIHGHKCVADCVANGFVRAAKMNRRHFEMLMGPAKDLMKEEASNSEDYKYYRDQQKKRSKSLFGDLAPIASPGATSTGGRSASSEQQPGTTLTSFRDEDFCDDDESDSNSSSGSSSRSGSDSGGSRKKGGKKASNARTPSKKPVKRFAPKKKEKTTCFC